VLVSAESLSATTFRTNTDVCLLKLSNAHGSVTILPYQGQQIWSAEFGRELTMRSPFSEPRPTRDFLANFGGFLQHCGLSGVGGPGPDDTHPIHGELHNAPYQSAYIITGSDERGGYIGVGGRYEHVIAFGAHYLAEPLVKLYAGETLINVSMTISNLSGSPLEYGYLAHVNFRPKNHARLVYSVPRNPTHVRVRTSIPAHITPSPAYRTFLGQLAVDPFLHEQITPDLAADPELVIFLDYVADADGWAHTLQVHPDGSADYLRHRPDQLPHTTRWISRTADQDAIALAEVGTCEPEGFSAEKAKGNIRTLAPGAQFTATFDAGLLSTAKTQPLIDHIQQLTNRPTD
jgi:hypothetical protein